MTTFVLVHGAFRGAWAWERVVPLLEAAGHGAVADDLPGAGARFDPDGPPVTLGDCIDGIVATFDRLGVERAVLVGHSQGGFVARAAAERLSDRLEAIAYLDAPVPRDGERAIDLVPPALGGGPVDDSALPAPGTVIEPPPTDDPLLAGRLTPLHVDIALAPVSLHSAAAAAVPERYAFCSATPPTFPCWHTRARLDAEGVAYDLLAADHDAPLTEPAAVAGWLSAD